MEKNIIGIGETALDVIFRNDNPTAAMEKNGVCTDAVTCRSTYNYVDDGFLPIER